MIHPFIQYDPPRYSILSTQVFTMIHPGIQYDHSKHSPENSNAIKNDNINIEEDKIIVKVSDVLKKLKSPCDCRNFALENSKSIYYYNIY